MAATGDYALPHLNGQIYSQKPPLLFWSILAAGRLTGGFDGTAGRLTGGVDETAARLPSALSGIGALLLVYGLGLTFFGRRAAWLAAAAFGTCFKILWQGRFGQIDMLLTCLVTLGVWLWARGYVEKRPRLYLLFFAAAGLATLAKGPVGLLPPLLSILVFLGLTRDREEVRRLRIGRGLLLWAAIVLAWLIPAGVEAGGEYLHQIVFRQNVTRYANPWHHFLPPWYYLQVVPLDFMPWTLLLPAGIALGWRACRNRRALRAGGQAQAAPLAERGALFALCWIAVTLLFFSISPAKRSVYVLTMYPAMALLVGAALDRIAEEWPRKRSWVVGPLAGLAVLVLLLVVGLPLAGHGRQEALPLGGDAFVRGVTATFVPLLLGAIAAWWLARRGRIGASAAALACGMGVFWLVTAFYTLPRFDTVKSARGLSRILVARLAPGEAYAIYPRLDSTFLFYTQRFAVELDSEAKLQDYVRRPGRSWLLIPRDELSRLRSPLPLAEVARDQDSRSGYLLFARPGP